MPLTSAGVASNGRQPRSYSAVSIISGRIDIAAVR
jgi:hypothetical protein